MIFYGNSIIRNPILVPYASKGILPYQGLGSGIKRALDAWPEIDFIDDRGGCLFTARVHRNAIKKSEDRFGECQWFTEKVGKNRRSNSRPDPSG